jgi:hypothetical protein
MKSSKDAVTLRSGDQFLVPDERNRLRDTPGPGIGPAMGMVMDRGGWKILAVGVGASVKQLF